MTDWEGVGALTVDEPDDVVEDVVDDADSGGPAVLVCVAKEDVVFWPDVVTGGGLE